MKTALLAVLIVEDEAHQDAGLRKRLADHCIATVSASSVAEAQTCLQRRNIVGVIIDHALAGGGADDLLRSIADEDYAPGAVLASTDPDAWELARRYGVECIPKPLRLADVLAAVQGFIAGAGQPRREQRATHAR